VRSERRPQEDEPRRYGQRDRGDPRGAQLVNVEVVEDATRNLEV
jgi:hypothetical protein